MDGAEVLGAVCMPWQGHVAKSTLQDSRLKTWTQTDITLSYHLRSFTRKVLHYIFLGREN